jgi:hypothetical protein
MPPTEPNLICIKLSKSLKAIEVADTRLQKLLANLKKLGLQGFAVQRSIDALEFQIAEFKLFNSDVIEEVDSLCERINNKLKTIRLFF